MRQGRQPQNRVQTHRSKASCLDLFEIPAAPFDVKKLFNFTKEVGFEGLDRGIAAAVQNQVRVTPQQPGRVDTQAKITRILCRFFLSPKTLHPIPRSISA